MRLIYGGILSVVVAAAVRPQRLKLLQSTFSSRSRGTHTSDGSESSRTSTWNCLVDTGIACKSACLEQQGSTQCQTGRCVCSRGCVGVDGYCREAKYKRANSTFVLRNAHWPSFVLAESSFAGALEVSSAPESADSHWMATELPSGNGQHQGLLLSTLSRPEHALSLISKLECDPENLDTCVMLWSASLQPLTEPEVSARGIAVLLQRAPGKLGNQGAVLIRPYLSWSGSHFLFVPRGSWGVGVSNGDPGPGGYWFMDPPMPELVMAADSNHQLRGVASRLYPLPMLVVALMVCVCESRVR